MRTRIPIVFVLALALLGTLVVPAGAGAWTKVGTSTAIARGSFQWAQGSWAEFEGSTKNDPTMVRIVASQSKGLSLDVRVRANCLTRQFAQAIDEVTVVAGGGAFDQIFTEIGTVVLDDYWRCSINARATAPDQTSGKIQITGFEQ